MRPLPSLTALALAAALCSGTQARAQAIMNLATGGSAGLGGLTFTVSGCASSSTAGLCNNVMMELTKSGNVVTAEFLGNGGTYGSNVLAVSNGSLQSFWFTLTVSATRAITYVDGAVAGSGGYNNTQINNISSGCTVSGGWSTGNYCAAYAYVGAPTVTSFGSVNSLNISYTLGVQGSSGQTLVLNNATSVFNNVPEPSGLAAMGTGLAGLFGARACRRRRGSAFSVPSPTTRTAPVP